MRSARTNDIWRRLFRRDDRKIQSLTIAFSDTTELGSGNLTFAHPINLICGENGVGKSAAIWTVAKALSIDKNLAGAHRLGRPKSDSGQIDSIVVKIKSEIGTSDLDLLHCAITEGDPEHGLNFAIIDPGLQIPHFLSRLRSDSNPQDLIDGVEPIALSAEELGQIKELTGRDYSLVRIYEIDDYAELPLFPYFSVKYADFEYNSLSMGLGELSLLYIFWSLRSLSSESIVLIEEPESFAASRSQRAFIDHLAYLCNENGHFAILSSHSGTIAERIPNEAIQLCSRSGRAVVFESNPSPALLVDRVALYLRNRFLVLVEDNSAREFCRAIVQNLDSRVSVDLDVLVSGSNSQVITAIQSLGGGQFERIRIVGVLDGDQRNAPPQNTNWPVICLPGFTNPDREIRDLVTSKSTGVIAETLNVSHAQLIQCLSGLEGIDEHDWTNRLTHLLNISLNQLYQKLMPLWVHEHAESAELFRREFRTALRLQ